MWALLRTRVGNSLYACANGETHSCTRVRNVHAVAGGRSIGQRSGEMERCVFHKLFKTGASPAVFPVIHVQNFDQTKRNVIIALRQGAQGVFLINHDFFPGELLPIIKQVRSAFPYLWLGVNFLGVTGKPM